MKIVYLWSRGDQRWRCRRKPTESRDELRKSDSVHHGLPKEISSDPARLAAVLSNADSAMRAKAITRVQRERGNLHVQRMVTAPASMSNDSAVIQRQQTQKPKAVSAATTTVGPPQTSTYEIKAKSLADLATQVDSMDEAGSVEWRPNLNYASSGTTGKITGATVTVSVDVSLPIWNPPTGTGPKTKAEWNRARNALKAHEDGHIKLVRKHFNGAANKLIGKTPEAAQELFDKITANLQKESDRYDGKTDHGRKTGTFLTQALRRKSAKK